MYCTLIDALVMRMNANGVNLPVDSIFPHYYTQEFRDHTQDDEDHRRNDNDIVNLGAGCELLLLSFEAKNPEEIAVINTLFNRLRMEIVYTDLDEKKEWIAAKKLSYFVSYWEEERFQALRELDINSIFKEQEEPIE